MMLDELSEMLDEGNVKGFVDWWKKLKHKVKNFSEAVWSGLSSASKKVYKLIIKGGKFAIKLCKKHEDICEELAKKGLQAAGIALISFIG